jgi:hypothetical protein
MPSAYQDRLGTNIGKALKKRCVLAQGDFDTMRSFLDFYLRMLPYLLRSILV